MSDFGDEMGERFFRVIQRPFDEWSRMVLRKVMQDPYYTQRRPRTAQAPENNQQQYNSNFHQTEDYEQSSSIFSRQYNDRGELDFYDISFDSRAECAFSMDLLEKRNIDYEVFQEANNKNVLRIKSDDLPAFMDTVQEYDAKITQGTYSPYMDKSLTHLRECPAQKEYAEFVREIASDKDMPDLDLSKDELTIGDINDYLVDNRQQIEASINTRVVEPISKENIEFNQKLDNYLDFRGKTRQEMGIPEPGYDMNDLTKNDARMLPSHDGMDPDGHTQVVESSWKDEMNNAIDSASSTATNLGDFMNRLREQGYGVTFNKNGTDLQVYDAGQPNHCMNLSNSRSKLSLDRFYGNPKTAFETSRAKQQEQDALSQFKERSLGELSVREIPSQQMLSR